MPSKLKLACSQHDEYLPDFRLGSPHPLVLVDSGLLGTPLACWGGIPAKQGRNGHAHVPTRPRQRRRSLRRADSASPIPPLAPAQPVHAPRASGFGDLKNEEGLFLTRKRKSARFSVGEASSAAGHLEHNANNCAFCDKRAFHKKGDCVSPLSQDGLG